MVKSDEALKFTQLLVQPWNGRNGPNSTLLGLSADGRVYRYKVQTEEDVCGPRLVRTGWVPLSMEVLSD